MSRKVEAPIPSPPEPNGSHPIPQWKHDLEAARLRRYAGVTGRRLVLWKKLDALEEEYGRQQRQLLTQEAQDACTRINQEREPLFRELWPLERELPLEERHFFPVRIMEGV